ncbi:MAG: methyltransferase domain-containing protein [Symploca sp. SIO3E6]|nr:methyltransferase domain-containing protein [Caldora sp. SIO3E6]
MNKLGFENYQETSKSYDTTRVPIGTEILLGCFASTPRPLSEQIVLDGGCGTGNYIEVLKSKVGTIYGLEFNEGMLRQGQQKFTRDANIHLTQGNLLNLPYEKNYFDGMMSNQVIHHLVSEEDNSDKFLLLAQMMQEAYRVLRPQGILVLNSCSQKQLFDGFWWADLIPQAMQRVAKRFPPLETITSLLAEIGFQEGGQIVPVDAVLQGNNYLEPEGPLNKAYRDGDSTWSLATEAELEQALERVRNMNADGSIKQYLEKRENLRRHIGQTTFIYAYKG